jgi:hypothetical protein
MTLREKQSLFVKLVAELIQFATQAGYEITFGEAWRTPEQAALNAKSGKGIKNSLHIERLAIDLNLFRDGKYLTGIEGHQTLGEWWENRHELCAWGGKFGDPNHYSLTHEGRK